MIASFFQRYGMKSLLLGSAFAAILGAQRSHAQPAITSVVQGNNSLVISVNVPGGYRHAVLEAGDTVIQPTPSPMVSGGMNGTSAILTFQIPNTGITKFFRLRVGTNEVVPPATFSGAPYFSVEYTSGPAALTEEEKIGHVLSRLSYGPSPSDVQTIEALGIIPFIDQQLNPPSITESTNLIAKEAELFTTFQPGDDRALVKSGDLWRYFKGTQAPPAGWNNTGFNDSTWLQGPAGFGFGDDDDNTELLDMRQAGTNTGYLTVFIRKTFNVTSPDDVDALILSVDFDDGFVAYLNGTEIVRTNVAGNPALFSEEASGDHEAGVPVDFDISANKSLLRSGENVLAVQLHNSSITSSDASINPSLLSRKFLPVPPQKRIRNIASLQELIHVRGIYSKRQLQAVLGEFWENHFTTDYDKVMEYFGNLRNSDAQDAMSDAQAAAEAAQAEYREYQFFYENALGNFGDLLLFSATSPAQLIYLDNVLNVKGAANENYAREILELFAFGVDNRYTQEDIEQLAKCFTGWTVRKVWPSEVQPFPASSRTPPTNSNVQFNDTVLLDAGPGWKYFKGTQEPSPGDGGVATTGWTDPTFNDAAWLSGATGIGFGDNDDATILTDMRNQYVSVYLRRAFTIADPASMENLLLSVDYDDGFVAYLNGTEVARSQTMQNTGTPPAYNRPANGGREAGSFQNFSLRNYLSLLKPAPEVNVLAIQVHNLTLDSSDVSIIPKLVQRSLRPGSIENGDPNGVWTFRFNPAQHDTNSKVLFRGTQYETTIPAGRTGIDGLRDAVDVIDAMVNHPSVAEFICLKLINKFVSDEIALGTYHDGTAPSELRALLDSAIQAWNSTTPRGNIRTVLQAILSPTTQNSHFWSRAAYRSKVKTAVEFINSTSRALGANVSGTTLPNYNDQLGMHLFTRDMPDGWSELGTDWIDTGTMLSRIKFAQSIAGDRITNVRWDVNAWRTANGLSSADSIVDYFNELLFHGKMAASNRALLINFATTDDLGAPLPLDPSRSDYAARVRELVGLILSMPQWHYQ